MSSVLIVSENGKGVPLALRLVQEGHIVKVCFLREEIKHLLEGFDNPKVVGSPKMLEQYDIIVFDEARDAIFSSGLGSGSFSYKLEHDLEYQQKVLDQMLEIKQPDEIEGGIRMWTEGWFNGGFLSFFTHGFPYERMMEGERGMQTETMGNVMWHVAQEDDGVIQSVLEPLTPLLEKVNYIGPVSVLCHIGEDALKVESVKCSFNFDMIQGWCELFRCSLFDFLWNVQQKDTGKLTFNSDYALSVRLSMPPYPYQDSDMLKGLKGQEVVDVPEPARSHVFLQDVMMNGNGKECLAGVSGVIGCVTARGSEIHEARKRAYRTVRNCVSSPDVQFRKDIGAGVEERIEKLKVWGWLDA